MLLRSARLLSQNSHRGVLRAPSCAARACMTTGNSRKRAMVRIGTHDGTFHCDEALGCYMLRRTVVRALALALEWQEKATPQ